MSDHSTDKAPTKQSQQGLDGHHRGTNGVIQRKGGDILGLRAFEKISAVEGIRLSNEMRADLTSLDARHMDERQRSRFINRKYGKS